MYNDSSKKCSISLIISEKLMFELHRLKCVTDCSFGFQLRTSYLSEIENQIILEDGLLMMIVKIKMRTDLRV